MSSITAIVPDFFTAGLSRQAITALKNVAIKGTSLEADGYKINCTRPGIFRVRHPESWNYDVVCDVTGAGRFSCNCQNHKKTGLICKHIYACYLFQQKPVTITAPTFEPRVQFAPEPVAVTACDLSRLSAFDSAPGLTDEPRGFDFWFAAAGYDAEMAIIDSAETLAGCDAYARF